jgi:Phosphoglycerol transferase and related proteins, alkaline phosphatase superfamily
MFDSMLNQFLMTASKTKWFKNTLIFVTSDTSNYQNPQKPFSNFEDFVKNRSRIPLLIIGGNIKKPYQEMRYFSQIDLAPTIMDILGFPYTNSWMGNSMLKSDNDSLAYTNRPGNYWSVMGLKGSYYNEADHKDHFFGFNNNHHLKLEYKQMGKDWINTVKWLLQENKIWYEE